MRRSTVRILGLLSLAGGLLSALLTPLLLPAGGYTYYGSLAQVALGVGLLVGSLGGVP